MVYSKARWLINASKGRYSIARRVCIPCIEPGILGESSAQGCAMSGYRRARDEMSNKGFSKGNEL